MRNDFFLKYTRVKVMKRVAVLIKNIEKREDAMRTVQGLNDKGNSIELFILEHDLEMFSSLFTQNRDLLNSIVCCIIKRCNVWYDGQRVRK